MHFIGGDPVSCSAQILTQGRPVQLGDLKEGNEGLGLMAGDELQACYRMSRGFWAKFDSRVNDKTAGLGFMLEIVCSSASIRIYPDRNPVVYIRRGNPYQFEGSDSKWVPWTTAGIGEVENNPELIQKVMTHVTGVE
ncbi:MAG: gfo/Idh/MocA family oxidoreductase, partial [Verrucomicrobia bacterium]|nr:gfo/Idh/MocA family oxidoreductase [Verrucomicrobiota bacterium]